MATAPGRGGVAVVRISGPAAFHVAETVTGRRVDATAAGRFFHATFKAPDGTAIDDGLMLVFAAPRSYTGEDVIELQGHGGSVAPRRVLESCLASGARLARRGEFSLRAFLNGKLDLARAEAVIDLVDARTERAADDAAGRLLGAQTRPFENLYASALDVSSLVEHALDFSEDELPPDFAPRVREAVNALTKDIQHQISTAREGRILREGALVVLAGPPNAGKSSLLNALLGLKRAIVSDEAGTTRDSIEESAEIGGWPVRLVDTAGLRETENTIEREGVKRAEELIAAADLVIHLVASDGGRGATRPTDASHDIVVISKCDIASHASCFSADAYVSAKTGEGLDTLRSVIAQKLTALAAKDAEETGADITTRQLEALSTARDALSRALEALDFGDWVIAADELRTAAESLGGLLGKVYSADLLDALFSRFCIGK